MPAGGVATGSTVITMAAEMGPDELTIRAIARCIGLQDPQVWRVLPRGRSDILFLVARDLKMRQTTAVAKHDGLRERTARARVEAHLARMLAFDLEPGVKDWRRLRRPGLVLDAPAAGRTPARVTRALRGHRARLWPGDCLRKHPQGLPRDGLGSGRGDYGANPGQKKMNRTY